MSARTDWTWLRAAGDPSAGSVADGIAGRSACVEPTVSPAKERAEGAGVGSCEAWRERDLPREPHRALAVL